MGITIAEAHSMAASAAARGIRMTFSAAKPRKEPKTGDRRVTKKHGEQVRIPIRHRGMYVVSNGRQCFQWVALDHPEIPSYLRAKLKEPKP